jgi:hypothetical protein
VGPVLPPPERIQALMHAVAIHSLGSA